VATRRARLGEPPPGLGQVMQNYLGQVRLGKVLVNYKDCSAVLAFSLGPLKLTCAQNRSKNVIKEPFK